MMCYTVAESRAARRMEARAPVSTDYRVVIDRMSYDHAYLKEMVKNMSLDGTYVINNPDWVHRTSTR